MTGHPIPTGAPAPVPSCVRCGHACPECTAKALPPGYLVVATGTPDMVLVDVDRTAPRDQIARQVAQQLQPGNRPRRLRRYG